ncbi:MAG: TonB-dependent receptor, partial [Pseudomonadota bacterium]|nr:TonB-dependent receptor [Pseudomonadota bacterium]
VLRDGAAAQYGSDAIAGVINIELKKSLGCESVVGAGEYSAHDGKNYLGTAYCGFRLGEQGSIGITGEMLNRGRSNRGDADSPRIIGDSLVRNRTVYVNGDTALGADGKLYFTAGVQDRFGSSAAFGRGGIGSDDIPSKNSAAMYPAGFAPFINADVTDHYGTIGYRTRAGDWNADFSQTYGFNKMHYNISHTLNASIANKDLLAGGKGISPSSFDAGGFQFQQQTSNADFSKFYSDIMGGLNVAVGAEYRKENYKIFAGEPGSYNDVDGLGFGGNAGSQGFPGFQPSDATDKDRHSSAAYLDLEADVTSRMKLQGALRYEKFSDFGSTVTGKVAGAYRLADAVLLRGSASTGFRAPSLQQVYFSSTFTDFVGGVAKDVVFAPNGGAVTNAAGIPKLKEEKSKSFTLGATWTPTASTSVTADLYRINIDDRIVLSGRFDSGNYPALGQLLLKLGVASAQFFVNSIDTRTQGLDLTISNKTDFMSGKLNTFLAMNFSATDVTSIKAPPSLRGFEDVLLSERERLFIEQGGPRRKATLDFDYTLGQVNTDFKIIHFGPQTLGTFSGPPTPRMQYASKTSADLAFTYLFSEKTKFTIGAANIFNVHPTAQDPNETDNGFKYESVQFGLNGTSYFARLWHKF